MYDLMMSLFLVAQGCVGPQFDSPIMATIQGSALTIPGSGFGEARPDSYIVVTMSDSQVRIASTSSVVNSWEDESIVLSIGQSSRSAQIHIRTPEGRSQLARVDVFAYDWFDIPPTPGTSAPPLSIDVDEEGQVWVNQEFHLDFQHLDPIAGVVNGLAIPRPPAPGPFATTIFNDHRTQTSVLGEDVLIDPQGRVWFTQGGGYLYSGEHANHSRIVCFDPDGEPGNEWRVYNMPNDWNEIIGLAWDETRGRMWVAQGGLEAGALIASFDPEKIPYDNHFDFSSSLSHQICEKGEPTDDCYRVYRLPKGSYQPAHLLIDNNGLVWYTAFWGNRIGVVHPESGRVIEYPLPAPIGLADPVPIVGSGPWELVKAPNGDIVFCEFFDSTIGRFRITRVLDPNCQSLGDDGQNPCISELIVPDVDLRNEQVHSIAYDFEGRLWFTQTASIETQASVGFITANWKHIVKLPSLNDFEANEIADSAGIAVDPTTGDIYFCEFKRKRIGRLQLVY